MKNLSENYFSTGELSSLLSIPKQTLLFYDKIGLLQPCFSSSNGYRYYSRTQYLALEIIVNLRKLDISIHKIKEFMDDRSPASLKKLLQEREVACNLEMKRLTEIKQYIHSYFSLIQEVEETQPEKIFLSFQKKQSFFKSDIIPTQTSLKKRTKIMAIHNQQILSKLYFKKPINGYLLDQSTFFSEKHPRPTNFFYPVSTAQASASNDEKPEGIYLTLQVNGIYCNNAIHMCDRLKEYILANHLEITSDIYIYPLKNYLLTKSHENYITQISFRVQHKRNT